MRGVAWARTTCVERVDSGKGLMSMSIITYKPAFKRGDLAWFWFGEGRIVIVLESTRDNELEEMYTILVGIEKKRVHKHYITRTGLFE